MSARIGRRLARLHRDEAGLKTLEVVALLAVACIILLMIKLFWYRIQNWFVWHAADAMADDPAPGGPPTPQ